MFFDIFKIYIFKVKKTTFSKLRKLSSYSTIQKEKKNYIRYTIRYTIYATFFIKIVFFTHYPICSLLLYAIHCFNEEVSKICNLFHLIYILLRMYILVINK